MSACGWGCRSEIIIESIEFEIVINSIEFVIESIEFEIVVNSIEVEIVVNSIDFEIDRAGNRSQATSKTIKAKTIT